LKEREDSLLYILILAFISMNIIFTFSDGYITQTLFVLNLILLVPIYILFFNGNKRKK
jgi:hypothetical protein